MLNNFNNEKDMLKMEELKELANRYQGYCEREVTMYLCDLPNIKVPRIIFNNGQDMYTNNETIVLGLGGYNVEDEEEFLLFTLYILGHEVQHIRSTPTKTWVWGQKQALKLLCGKIAKKFLPNSSYRLNADEDIKDFLKDLEKENIYISLEELKRLIHFVMNSLEDGRIERIRLNKRAGFKRQVILFRGKIWGETPIENTDQDDLIVILNQILSLSTTSLYQKGFHDFYIDTEVEKKVYNLQNNIAKAVISSTNIKCMEEGIKICEKLSDEIIDFVQQNGTLEKIMKDFLDKLESFQNGKGEKSTGGQYSNTTFDEEQNENNNSSPFGQSELELELTEEEYSELKKSSQDNEDSNNGSFAKITIVDENGNDITEKVLEKEEGAEKNSGKTSSSENNEESEKNKGKKKKEEDNTEEKSNNSLQGNNSSSSNSSKPPKLSQSQKTDRYDTGSRNVGDCKNETSDNGDIERKIKEEMENAAKEANNDIIVAKKSSNKINKDNSATIDDSVLPDISDVKNCYSKDIIFKEVKRAYNVDTDLPSELEARSRTFKKKVDSFFKNKESLAITGKKSGSLDGANVYKLAMNRIDCFYKKGIKTQFEGACYILCDNSGSMGNGVGSKRHEACKAISIIEKAFSDKMPLKVVAFDADFNYVIHEVIKNWNEKFKKSTAYNFFKKGRSGCGNMDGYSIRVATKELMGRPEKKKILIILSDGTPSNYNSYNQGLRDVSDAVDEARKKGIDVVSIFFPDGYSSREKEAFTNMYKFNCITTEPEHISNELIRIIKKFIA